MLIREVTCPACQGTFIVERDLWAIGEVRLHCPECLEYFSPSDSPRRGTATEVVRASVEITVWEPSVSRDFR
jgi:predicted Zn finger-like uncharacterized protein